MKGFFTIALFATSGFNDTELIKARDRQDRAALEKLAGDLRLLADKDPKDAAAQYRFALAESYFAEVAIETRDKAAAKNAAQTGIDAAERAINLKGDSSEYQRLLGPLCGQAISANSLAAIKYGKCALSSVNRAIELDPKPSVNYLSHGVGNYYLPPAFGGGIDVAIKDFRKAIELNPKNADAWLWLGRARPQGNHPDGALTHLPKKPAIKPKRAGTVGIP